MELTQDEFSVIGRAIAVITCPQHFKKHTRQEVCAKLLEIMDKYMPREEE